MTTVKANPILCVVVACALFANSPQGGANAGSGDLAASSVDTSAVGSEQHRAPTTSVSASQVSLPIAQGLFVADYSGSCAAATELYYFDGRSVGYIIQALPGNRMNSPRDAALDAHNIRRTGQPVRGSKDFKAELVGFTRIWLTDDLTSGAGFPIETRGIKPTGAGGFILREGSMSAHRMEFDDTSYRRCSFSQLSPQMQGTVRKFRPLFATGSPPPSSVPVVAAKGSNSSSPQRIPLATGYYAYVEGTFSTCAKPVGSPWYFDGARFWEEWDFTDPRHETSSEALKWEMVGPDRFRITYRSRDEDGRWDSHRSVSEFVITSPRSFTFVGTVGGPLRSNEKHQLCPTAQLPAKARWYKGAR